MKKPTDSQISHVMAGFGRLGGAARQALLTPEQRSELGRRGGAARAASLTPERRSEIARNAVATRDKNRARKKRER